jgi:hypothetical protein
MHMLAPPTAFFSPRMLLAALRYGLSGAPAGAAAWGGAPLQVTSTEVRENVCTMCKAQICNGICNYR